MYFRFVIHPTPAILLCATSTTHCPNQNERKSYKARESTKRGAVLIDDSSPEDRFWRFRVRQFIRMNNATRNREKDDGRDLTRNMSGSVSSRTLCIFFELFCCLLFRLKPVRANCFHFFNSQRSTAYSSSNSTLPNSHP